MTPRKPKPPVTHVVDASDQVIEVGGERVAPAIQAVMADRERQHAEMQARLDAENARRRDAVR